MYRTIQRHSVKIISLLDTVIGTLLCISAVALLAALFASSSISIALPLICLAVVLAVATRFGAATGVLGTILSALLLAYFVFSPQNSLHVANAAARNNLSWLLLGGIVLSFLFAPGPAQVYRERHRNRRSR